MKHWSDYVVTAAAVTYLGMVILGWIQRQKGTAAINDSLAGLPQFPGVVITPQGARGVAIPDAGI